MTDSDAKKIFLIRAMERSDAGGGVWSPEIRVGAAKECDGASLLESGSMEKGEGDRFEPEEARFLAARAERLEAWLRKVGAFPKGGDAKAIPGWLGPLLITAVLLVGFFSANLGRDGSELNILALPLLGILAWNLVVYVLAVVGLLTGASGKRAGILTALARKLGKVRKAEGQGLGSAKGLGAEEEIQFAVEWFEEALPVHGSRLGTVLHLAAAALAVGGVAGLFYQGWSVQYVAVWENTLFNAESLSRFFGFLFAPASGVLGVGIPLETLPEIQRGVGLEHRGGDALPWLQLYAGTMGIFVVVPRLILAAIYGWHTARLRSQFPLSPTLRPYLTEILRSLKGESQIAEVIPYSFEPEPRVRDAVRGLLHELWGGGIYPDFHPSVDYGDEEEFLEGALSSDPKYVVLLMNFSATPEDEAHGFLGKRLRQKIAADPGGSSQSLEGRSLLVLLDGSGFARRFSGLPEFGRRVEERKAAWARVMERAGLEVATVHLPGDEGAGKVAEVAGRVWSTGEGSRQTVEAH